MPFQRWKAWTAADVVASNTPVTACGELYLMLMRPGPALESRTQRPAGHAGQDEPHDQEQ
jgi:hypothetical protein